MTSIGWSQIIFFAVAVLAFTKPLGLYMAHVLENDEPAALPFFKQCVHIIYKFCGVNSHQEMSWGEYTAAMLSLSLVSCLWIE